MIPPFNNNNVIPPYEVTPSDIKGQSPYKCDILEFCRHFSTSAARINILKGFLNFRMACVSHGISGFQWIDGSFVENIEQSDSRDPHDIDVISFITLNGPEEEEQLVCTFPAFCDFKESKRLYYVDHYPVVINKNLAATVRMTAYWISLFSHNRRGIWKGMLEIPLYNSLQKDEEAMNYINSLPYGV